MNKSQRIWISSGTSNLDRYMKVKLEQDVDTLEIMSLKLDTKEAYQNFNASYGVLVGRVTANGGIGIPNAKVAVFIPLQEEDKYNGDIVSVYPYSTPREKDNYGKRYNLLPRVGKVEPVTKVVRPKQPFGSFPIKEEVVTNETQLEVYNKYYKYTTVTNAAGDYMIFGVPTGTQTIHMSCDITDIGEFSMNPAAMVTNLGYSPNLFTDNQSKIKPSNDLDDLPNIETQEITVDIIPFWGDTTNFEIGITQQDFRIRAELVNTFTLFGSVYTDGDDSMTGNDYITGSIRYVELYRLRNIERQNLSIASKRIGKVTESIYYYPASVTDEEIDSTINPIDPIDKMVKLSPSEYSAYRRDGDFAFIINCNRNRVTTNEFGVKVPVSNDAVEGVFTKFRGFAVFEITGYEIPMDFNSYLDDDNNKRGKVTPFRYKLKFPQSASRAHSFRKEDGSGSNLTSQRFDNQEWRREHYQFSGGSMYSVALFHGTVRNSTKEDNANVVDGFIDNDVLNKVDTNQYNNTGAIQVNDFGYEGGLAYEMPGNSEDDEGREMFAANWMNFSIHLQQQGFLTEDYGTTADLRSNSNFSQNFKNTSYYYTDNQQEIVAGDFNTKHYARSDLHYTDFIVVPPQDIITILEETDTKGFKFSAAQMAQLEGDYRNGYSPCPENGGYKNTNSSEGRDPYTYFFRGWGGADCIQYLVELGLI